MVAAEVAIFVVASALDVAVTMLWIVVGQAMVFDVVRPGSTRSRLAW